MRIYLSGKITGREKEDYTRQFARAESFYKTEGAFNDECQLTHKQIENYFIVDESCPLKESE